MLLTSGLGSIAAEELGDVLNAAGVPFLLRPRRHYGLTLYVTTEQAPAALALLEQNGIVPAQPGMLEEPLIVAGGACPACGADVASGSVECPSCGLRFARPEGTRCSADRCMLELGGSGRIPG
jgi:hypothetical protein